MKVFGFPTGTPMPIKLASQVGVGGILETICGALLLLGLFSRPAAFLMAGQMAVAYFQFHWKLNMDNNMFLPIMNKGELSALYCFVFFLFALSGAGAYSIDARRGRM